VLIAAFGIALIFSQMNSTFGLAVMRSGFSPKVYGTLLSLNGALVVLFELPLTTVTRRFQAMSVIALGYLFVGIGFGMTAFGASIPGYVACVAVFTLGEMCAMPVTSAFVVGLSPANMRGRYMGAYGLTWTLAQVVGPGAGMALFAASPTVFWLVSGGLGVGSALIAFKGRTTVSIAPSIA